MLAPLDVYLLDQRSERGRFAAANGTGDENQAVLIAGQQLQCFRQAELVHGPHFCVDDAEDEIRPKTLPDDTGTETAEAICVGKIGVPARGELCPLRVGEEAVGESRGASRR